MKVLVKIYETVKLFSFFCDFSYITAKFKAVSALLLGALSCSAFT